MAKEETEGKEINLKEELFKQVTQNQGLIERLNKANEVIENYKRVNAGLAQRLEETNLYNVYKRLDYGFKVLEFESSFPLDFVESNKQVIMQLMSTSDSKEEEENKE